MSVVVCICALALAEARYRPKTNGLSPHRVLFFFFSSLLFCLLDQWRKLFGQPSMKGKRVGGIFTSFWFAASACADSSVAPLPSLCTYTHTESNTSEELWRVFRIDFPPFLSFFLFLLQFPSSASTSSLLATTNARTSIRPYFFLTAYASIKE